MTRRAFRLVFVLFLTATTLAPSGGHADDETCRLAEDRPAYVCAGGFAYRTVTTLLNGRGLSVFVFGFEGTGVLLPNTETRASGACVLIVGRGAYADMCGLPFDVTVDPLLETATIKGSTRNKTFGLVAVNLTIDARNSDPALVPGAGGLVAAGCGGAESWAGSPSLFREGAATGTVRIGKTALRAGNRPTLLIQYPSAGGVTEVATPCAKERAESENLMLAFSCLGTEAAAAWAGSCNSTKNIRGVAVKVKNKTTSVRITAMQRSADPVSSVPDPSWIDPMNPDPWWADPDHLVPEEGAMACMDLTGRAFGFGICTSNFEIDIDPLLRTAHIKGEFPSPFEFFGDGFPMGRGMPSELDFGQAFVDLTIVPQGGKADVIGRTTAWSFAGCRGVEAVDQTMLMQSDGNARGYIVFKKRLGSFRPTAIKPLPATMDSRAQTVSFTHTHPSPCGGDEYEDE